MNQKAIQDIVNGFKSYKTWLYQAYYNLSSKYRRTLFGTLWIASNYVFMSIATSIVFGTLFQRPLTEIMPHNMAGLLILQYILWVVVEAPETFISSANIIRNHAYPFTYFTLENLARNAMLLGHNAIIYYIFMAILGELRFPDITVIPGLIVLTMTLFLWGTVVGMFSARYRDLRYLLPNFAFPIFLLTPVYWSYDMLGSRTWIADYSPFYHLLSIVRQPLLGLPPTAANWSGAFGSLALGAILYFFLFPAYRRRIPFWV